MCWYLFDWYSKNSKFKSYNHNGDPLLKIVTVILFILLLFVILLISLCRFWEISENNLVGFHLQLWRGLWTLSRSQLRVCHRDILLVLQQTLQGLRIIPLTIKSFNLNMNIRNLSFLYCATYSLIWKDLKLEIVPFSHIYQKRLAMRFGFPAHIHFAWESKKWIKA